MRQVWDRLIRGSHQADPIVLTWSLFLWAYCVPMLIFLSVMIGGFYWMKNQNEELHNLSSAHSKTNVLLCQTANRERDILNDLLTDLRRQDLTPGTTLAFRKAQRRLKPQDCTNLPSKSVRK